MAGGDDDTVIQCGRRVARFNLSDPAVEESLYDSSAMRRFVDIDIGREPVPDETTVCRFRHLLDAAGSVSCRDGSALEEELFLHIATTGKVVGWFR
jgi:IS5 family transposase